MSAGGAAEIGWYVHHQGAGHLHRATTLAQGLVDVLGVSVTGLSSAPAPSGWPGRWLHLPHDAPAETADTADTAERDDVTASGRLHWVPRHHRGLAARGAMITRYLHESAPRLMVVDVSVEVTLLSRLHGVPVVSVVVPGERDDAAHVLGHDVSEALVGFWPEAATPSLMRAPSSTARRLRALGAVSRHDADVAAPGADRGVRTASPRRSVVLLAGRGGDDWPPPTVDRARELTPDWSWTVLGPPEIGGRWHADPRAVVRSADVVVTHAGQNALAEVAALRRPCVVVPAARPHDEQRATARALADLGLPAVVVDDPAGADWSGVLQQAAGLDASDWSRWNDGRATGRFVRLVEAAL
ncbi:hypothetical protein KLP28_13180 [Nocardioidaceae bacterium]|nr:hypothetical protein KLP28_13180 [Nocardioidaceae bacterium]